MVSDPKSPTQGRIAAGRRAYDRVAAGFRADGTGRLSSPGQLQAGPDTGIVSPDADGVALATLALQYGLQPSARRASPPEYVQSLWRRRHFIMAFATARNIAMYTEAKLGQLWQILTPLLNAGVYLFIFGYILDLSKGIPDYPAFLVSGVFVFNFTQRAFISTSTVITDSLPLIRALQFPRAALPLAYVMIELQQMIVTMAVLAIILLGLGEPLTWYWLLAIPALLLQTAFNVGVGLFVARLGSQVNDFSQLLPFLLRTWMYLSGVLFSIATLADSRNLEHEHVLIALLTLNPAALYITLIRLAMIQSQRLSQPGYKLYNAAKCEIWKHLPSSYQGKLLYYSAYCKPTVNPDHYWYYAIGWAVVALVVGFFFFWRAETRYGRG
jgi:teichoic acid transport system permease protein